MEGEPLHVVDLDDSDAPVTVPPGILACQECTILIGPGYLEREPFAHPARSGAVCWRCFESLERRAQRGETIPPQRMWDPRQRR
jgi:hypothetical protein